MTVRRVAIVVPGLPAAGGVPEVAAFLFRAMASSADYEPYLFSLPMSSKDKNSVRILDPMSWLRGPLIGSGKWNGWSYQSIGAIGAEIEYQRYKPRRILSDVLSDYDIIQVVAGTPAWAYATRHLRKPVFLQVASLTMTERQALFRETSGLGRIWLKTMSRIVTRLEDAALPHLTTAFVENKWMYEHLRQRMDPARVVFAPPGVNTKQFSPGTYQPDGYILSVGRLQDPRKNVPLLFRAYHQLRQMMPAAPELVLAGMTMPDSSTWQLAEELGIANHITKIQNVSAVELAELYRKASLFVLSSDEEGLGIVILEAMASGIPVVATRCGGPDTAVLDGETGYLVPIGDARALAERMEQVLIDPVNSSRLGQAGRKRAESEFSVVVTARKFLEQYDLVSI